MHIIYDYGQNDTTASSTISKEDFKKLQDKLEKQWKTDFPEEEQPFKVIFNEPSEEDSTNQIEDLINRAIPKERVEKLMDELGEQWTTFLNQACIQTSINNLTERPNYTEG